MRHSETTQVVVLRRSAVLMLIFLALPLLTPSIAAQTAGEIAGAKIRFAYDQQGVSGIAHPDDPFGAMVVPDLRAAGQVGGRRGRGGRGQGRLTLALTYHAGDSGDWTTLAPEDWAMSAAGESSVSYVNAPSASPLMVTQSFRIDGEAMDWQIDVESRSDAPIRIGDLGITVPAVGPRGGSDPRRIFEQGFMRHDFVSGDGSFFYFVRASGAPPFLLVTTRPGTHLEYRGRGTVYVHSSLIGGNETRGTWRQEHTALDLAPRGRPGSEATLGFRFRFANGWEELRELLYQEGLFDIRVVPGMTVPEDLTARFSLHTKADIESIRAEFPDQTTVTSVGQPLADHHVYEVEFRRLGENMLTIHHDGGCRTYLEFFVTEPMETMIKKRARFLVENQQIVDPTRWWDGVYAPYDMQAGSTRTMEDPDIFLDRMVYVLTSDDPGLSKAPYIAAKNVAYPDAREIESLEYYLENFVWGGLQRRDDERPYPYGIYGTPDWYTNRDPERRRVYAESLANGATALRDLSKEHVWRSYDYPHVIMLYFHMYQIAKMHPDMSKYLDAAGYLERAWGTAKAFFTYPYEIYPSYYDNYKWGLYNELVVPELIDALELEGFPKQAEWLRGEWEKKVKYFVYDDPYPFRSEYAFDRTAFESTYAFAKYGATHDMQPDSNLWYDLRLHKWYSHPFVRREHSRAFMDRQLAAGLSLRGWINPAYYTLGCDAGVSYMAAMGGAGILDYGINFAARPWDWLQLGYASYLSSWCLMNTGRAETDYGYWFPGRQNDGAAGWQFMSDKVGNAWMGSSYPGGVQVPRGPWNYDGEIDLGFGGALRMATTIVTDDPVFGWFAYGGVLSEDGDQLTVHPRDGIRRRFEAVIPDPSLPFPDGIRRLKLKLERDGFADDDQIVLDKKLERISFSLENRTGDQHNSGLLLSLPAQFQYEVRQDGEAVNLIQTDDWDYPWRADLTMVGDATRVRILRTDRTP